MEPAILWDFDGTLATRPGYWSQAMVEVLDDHDPGHAVVRDDVRATLRDGFPWHRPYEPHPHLNDPERWWEEVGQTLAAGFARVGYARDAAQLVVAFRERFCDPSGWVVFDDTLPSLDALRAAGMQHVIVSNHMPELADLVDALGIGRYVEEVVCSATVGHEKPHPAIFHAAIAATGGAAQLMVGDNPVADVQGARDVGLDAVLVRGRDEQCRWFDDLTDLTAELLQG